MECVGFDGDDVVRGEFFGSAREHLVGEVGGEDGCRFRWAWTMLVKCHGHVAGAAAEVEGDCLRMLEDGAKEACGASPPVAIDAGREEVVGAVVGGGDGVEHLLNVRGGCLLVCRADGAGSGGAFVLGFLLRAHAVRFFVLTGAVVWLRMRVSMDWVAARSSGSVRSRTISVVPMAVGRTKERMPLRFFLSREVRATSFSAVALKRGKGP